MRIEFQYLESHAQKPDNITITDVPFKVDEKFEIPQRGDYVMLPISYPENQRGNVKHFEVVARHFFYTNDNPQDYMIIIVKDAPELPEMNFRE